MRNHTLHVILLLTFMVPAIARADSQTITLKDGSQIKGSLKSVTDGIYNIQTPLLGEIHINGDQVLSITNGAQPPAVASTPPAATAPAANLSPQIQQMQTQIMTNPAMMIDIQQMVGDPEIMNILSDKSFVDAVTSQNIQAVQTSPHMQELMSNPKMKALIEKIQGTAPSQ